MLAIISDLHSNLEALQAVWSDMAAFPVSRVVCLGDVIGYGSNPREVLKDVGARCEFMLLGNHERGLMEGAGAFNDRAYKALLWTQAQLNARTASAADNAVLWGLIEGMAESREENGRLFVHASPVNPIEEYVLPADALDQLRMSELFRHIEGRVGFGGHTHVPGVFPDGGQLFRHESEFQGWQPLPAGKAFVNVGSVGQPRDGDPRSCYLLVDGDRIQFRRVAYDVEKAMAKIVAVPELDNFLAHRLKVGK
jgi:diadenosine tetraphosphatase ApaH/serine/threonine PP2A family protein phosphatase